MLGTGLEFLLARRTKTKGQGQRTELAANYGHLEETW